MFLLLALAETGPGLAHAEEEFKGAMSSLAFGAACDKRFQAPDGHGCPVETKGSYTAAGRSRDSVSPLSPQGTKRGRLWRFGLWHGTCILTKLLTQSREWPFWPREQQLPRWFPALLRPGQGRRLIKIWDPM